MERIYLLMQKMQGAGLIPGSVRPPGVGNVNPLRESMPRQVDKKSGVPKEETWIWDSRGGDRGLEFSRRRKGQTFFFFKPEADDYTIKQLSLNSVLRII